MSRSKKASGDRVWADWLSDEPLPSLQRSDLSQQIEHLSSTDQGRSKPVSQSGKHISDASQDKDVASLDSQQGISIQISMPAITRPTWIPRMRSMPWKKIRSYALICGSFTILAVGARAGLGLFVHGDQSPGSQDVKGISTTKTGTDTKPAYAPLVPKSKKELATPGRGSGTYDAVRQMYVFNDKMSGANLIVSQQPVPKEVTVDNSQLEKIAGSVGARQSFATAFGEAYMSQKEESGEQIVVFAFQDRLVFIRSDKRFDSENWKFYIEALRKSE